MKKFHFKLKTVEKVRSLREKLAFVEFSKAQSAYYAELAKKDRLISTLKKALQDREDLGKKILPPSSYETLDAFVIGTKARIIQQDHAIVNAQRNFERVFVVYIESRKKRKTIGLLREKAYEKYKKEVSREGDKQLDDLYTMRFGKLGIAGVMLLLFSFGSHSVQASPGKGRKPDSCLADRAVLLDIKKQKKDLIQREKELSEKENQLVLQEKALNERIVRLEELRKELEGLNGQLDKKREANVAKLVETLEKMSPKTASKLLTTVSDDLAVTAFTRLSTAKLAKIMNAMDTTKTAKLSEIMANGGLAKTIDKRKRNADLVRQPAEQVKGGESDDKQSRKLASSKPTTAEDKQAKTGDPESKDK